MLLTGIEIGFQLVNIVFLIGGIFAFVLFVVVMVKLNKALNIWLKKNRDE
jgi:hypothetical protein